MEKILKALKSFFQPKPFELPPDLMERLERGEHVILPRRCRFSPVIDTDTVLKRISELEARLKKIENQFNESDKKEDGTCYV